MKTLLSLTHLRDMINRGEVSVSRIGLRRIQHPTVTGITYAGLNGHDDECYDLDRVTGAVHRVYLHRFDRPNQTGAKWRAYVELSPMAA